LLRASEPDLASSYFSPRLLFFGLSTGRIPIQNFLIVIMLSQNTILAPLDAANLQDLGLVGPVNTHGTRRLHRRRLNRSSDEEHSDIPLNALMQSPAAFAEIPEGLISLATLVHIGFSFQKAAEIWHRWTNWPTSGPRRETDPEDGGFQVTFIDFMIGRLNQQHDTWSDIDQEWQACLNANGIADELQRAILDPKFKYLRHSESCLFWVKDTILMRYAGLKDIQRASHEREMQIRNQGTGSSLFEPPRSVPASGFSGSGSGSGSGSSGHQRHRSTSGLQRESTPWIGQHSTASARAIAARNAPGCTVLFKRNGPRPNCRPIR
jgi:hypothetical protein